MGDLAEEHAILLGPDLGVMCALIRRGCLEVTELQRQERPEPRNAGLAVIPEVSTKRVPLRPSRMLEAASTLRDASCCAPPAIRRGGSPQTCAAFLRSTVSPPFANTARTGAAFSTVRYPCSGRFLGAERPSEGTQHDQSNRDSERVDRRDCNAVQRDRSRSRRAGRLRERQIDAGSSGIVVCGSTGEASSLSPKEHALAVRTAAVVANARVPVIADCTGAATSVSLSLAAAATRDGADALLCAAPPYVKSTQEGMIAHLHEVGQASDLPVILYDVPSRTSVAIADSTVATLFERAH